MTEIATIARPYAEALFQAERSNLPLAQEWLDDLAVVAADDRLKQFASDPRMAADQVFQMITGVLPKSLPDRGVNFLRVVIANERVAVLPEVARQFRLLVNGATGVADALVQSA